MPAAHSDGSVRVGDWIVDPAVDTLSRAGEIQKLEPRTMRLLMCLVESEGAVVSQDKLLTEVWSGVVVGSASVYQAISQLRKILGDTDPQPTYIATVPRKGYRLIAPVLPLAPDQPVAPVQPAAPAAPVPGAPTTVPSRTFKWPVIVLLVLVVVGATSWFPLRRYFYPDASAASVVVLPFIDMTAEKTDQPFCDGLTEELSNWLAQIPTLRVVARTSAFAFRGQGEDVRKIGRTLDIDHIVEGSMRRFGDHMRITVQLIDARNGYHLWSADYDRPLDDTIKMQEDISRNVAQTLQIRLTADTDKRFSSRRTTNPEAYQQYILARQLQQLRTRESTDRAIDLYKQVLIADPHFALAYVGLSQSILNQGYFRSRPVAEVTEDVEPLIATALDIDPRLSDVYAVRGSLRNTQYRIGEALEDLRHALAINPNDSAAFAIIGRILLYDGRPRESLASYRHAAALDPLDSRTQVQQCIALGDLARYVEAAAACSRALALQPGSSAAMDESSWLAIAQGNLADALRWNSSAIKAEPENFDLYWTRADIFMTLGLGAKAHEAIDQGRKATGDDESADAALARVVYCESGPAALRAFLEKVRLDRSIHATSLLEAAYARLLLGEAAAVKPLIGSSVSADDRAPGLDEIPWYARIGNMSRIDLATADLELGDSSSAAAELAAALKMLNGMIEAGVSRHEVYELRARVYALSGNPNAAMKDLQKAADLGFRRAWWALREPYLASLRSRSDFQSLMKSVSQSNDPVSSSPP